MSQSYLQRQRKQTLLDLSKEIGLSQDKDDLKDEIVDKLHQYLQTNAPRLSSNSTLEGYYGTRRGSPAKREGTIGAIVDEVEEVTKSVVKGRGRRPTKVKQETDDEAASPLQTMRHATESVKQATSSALTKVSTALTPRTSTMSRPTSAAVQRRRQSSTLISSLPGPPSPSALADAMEEQSQRAVASLRTLYDDSPIPSSLAWARDTCSTLSGIQLTFLLLEGIALHRTLIKYVYAVDTPAYGIGKTSVYLPDLFVLLTGHYWSATTLWTATSIAIPAAFAWLFNLTLRDGKRGPTAKYAVDPLMFNIVKALVTFAVYGQGFGRSIISTDAVDTINHAMYGGYAGILTGCGVGILASLYDAALRK